MHTASCHTTCDRSESIKRNHNRLSGRSAFGVSCSNKMVLSEAVKTETDKSIQPFKALQGSLLHLLLNPKCLLELLNTCNIDIKPHTNSV